MTNRKDGGADNDPIQMAIDALYGVSNIPIQSEDSQWRQSAIDEALSALRQHQQDGGWLPIESAPRDGTYLLGYWTNHNGSWFGVVTWDGDHGWTYCEQSEPLSDANYLTHWQPLPPPPQKERD